MLGRGVISRSLFCGAWLASVGLYFSRRLSCACLLSFNGVLRLVKWIYSA